MKTFSAVFLVGVMFAGCANTPASKSHREILQGTIPMTARLDRLAIPLRKAGADLCGDKVGDDGLTLHQLSDYPELYRPVAKSLWDLGEEGRILYVRPDSAAHNSGLKFGDIVPTKQVEKLTVMNTDCAYDVRVRIDTRPNAYADGETVFVTTGLMGGADDLPLSLVIAHELAHNVLGHVGMEISKDNERKADRWAVFLLARANLDYAKAVADPVSIGTDKDKQGRTEHFKTVMAEIDKLREQGASLIP